jgi:hypothetical protein
MQSDTAITPKQKAFLLQLRTQKGLQDKFTEADLDRLTVSRASAWISRALELPDVAPRPSLTTNVLRPHEDDVPAGRYAIEEDGVLKFFRVDRPTEGKWAGWVFLKIQASDDLYPIKDRARCEFIFKAIAHDPRAASIRYGRELGHCGICGKTLTDPTSIENGIGPVCAGRVGW